MPLKENFSTPSGTSTDSVIHWTKDRGMPECLTCRHIVASSPQLSPILQRPENCWLWRKDSLKISPRFSFLILGATLFGYRAWCATTTEFPNLYVHGFQHLGRVRIVINEWCCVLLVNAKENRVAYDFCLTTKRAFAEVKISTKSLEQQI